MSGRPLHFGHSIRLAGCLTRHWHVPGHVAFLHELAHRFIAQRFSDAPPWLNEGLAQFYSTLRIQDGKVTVGGSLSDRDFSERPFFWMSWYENGSQLQIPALRGRRALGNTLHATCEACCPAADDLRTRSSRPPAGSNA